MVFGLYDDFNGGPPLSRLSNILYQSSSRTIWAIGLGYIVYACLTSNGGHFNKILSLPFWTPLSRLSFSTYLIHSTIVYTMLYSMDHPSHLQDTIMVRFLFMLILCYLNFIFNFKGLSICWSFSVFIYSCLFC